MPRPSVLGGGGGGADVFGHHFICVVPPQNLPEG
jgi:hypothetical protein